MSAVSLTKTILAAYLAKGVQAEVAQFNPQFDNVTAPATASQTITLPQERGPFLMTGIAVSGQPNPPTINIAVKSGNQDYTDGLLLNAAIVDDARWPAPLAFAGNSIIRLEVDQWDADSAMVITGVILPQGCPIDGDEVVMSFVQMDLPATGNAGTRNPSRDLPYDIGELYDWRGVVNAAGGFVSLELYLGTAPLFIQPYLNVGAIPTDAFAADTDPHMYLGRRFHKNSQLRVRLNDSVGTTDLTLMFRVLRRWKD